MARKKLPPELKAKNHTFKLYDWEVESVKKYIKICREVAKGMKELENNPNVHMMRIGNIEVKEVK
jgi:hypothetical protein